MPASHSLSEPDVLLHACCGPCAVGVVSVFEQEGHCVLPFFYNPNIHPAQEFLQRLEAFHKLCTHHGLPAVVVAEYGLEMFLEAVLGSDKPRCEVCYELRLFETARRARARGMKYFSTTLTISPYQNHELIQQVGRRAAKAHGVEFIYKDLRERLKVAHEMSDALGLYRQRYCGCIFSEQERYARALARAAEQARSWSSV